MVTVSSLVVAAVVLVGLLLPAQVPPAEHSTLIAAKRATVFDALFRVTEVLSVTEATGTTGVVQCGKSAIAA